MNDIQKQWEFFLNNDPQAQDFQKLFLALELAHNKLAPILSEGAKDLFGEYLRQAGRDIHNEIVANVKELNRAKSN